MKNPDLIPINEDLKKIKFLYIENDPKLGDLDKDCIENALGGRGQWADLIDFDIDYQFDAFMKPDTFDKIKAADHILINSSFIGASYTLLQNFLCGVALEGLKDKVIINCTQFKRCEDVFEDLEEFIELAEENNISFYFPSQTLDAFIKHNNKEGYQY